MNSTSKRVLSLFLTVIMTVTVFTATAFTSSAVSKSEIISQVESDYKKALKLKGWGSFYGHCNLAVAYQLLAKGVYTGSSPDYRGGGSEWYYDYRDRKTTSGDYNVVTVGGSNCIDELINKYGNNLTNIAVSYGTGGTSGSTHVVVISAIIDGEVYFTDSFRYGSSPEGGCRIWSLDFFKSEYKRMNGNPYGLVYFSKSDSSISIDREDVPEFTTGEYAIVVDSLNVRSTASTSGSILGQLDSHAENSQENTVVNILEIKNDKWGKIDFNGQTGWICLYNGKFYATKIETAADEDVNNGSVSDSTNAPASEEASTSAYSSNIKNGTTIPLTIVQVSLDKDSVKTDMDIIWIATVVGGSGKYEYCFDVNKDGNLYKEGEFSEYREFFFTASEAGEYSVTLTVKDSDGKTAQFRSDVTEIESKTEILIGDVNLDGKVTAADARITLRAAAGLEKLEGTAMLAADIDGSGKVNAADARIILRIAANIEKPNAVNRTAAEN